MAIVFRAASLYSLADLTDLMNWSFTNYIGGLFDFSHETFADFIYRDNVSLNLSQVMLWDDDPIGLGLIARHGWTSRLAMMGIVPEYKGKGMGKRLMRDLIQQAHERDDHYFVLEVLQQNTPAVKLYKKYGFQVTRQLLGYTTTALSSEPIPHLYEIDTVEVAKTIMQNGPTDLPWQLSGMTIANLGPPHRGYKLGPAQAVITDPTQDMIALRALIVPITHQGQGHAARLVQALMAFYPDKTWKVPAIFPEPEGHNLFEQLGFTRDAVSQYQMELAL